MAKYTPTQGVFVNGRVADADDVMNEFDTIATAINDTDTESATRDATNLKEAKDYTDAEIQKAHTTIDGGTF
jgi:hypothetical protein